MKIWSLLFFIVSTSHCASQYQITSKPDGADIYLGKDKLGTTPLTFTGRQVFDKNGGGVLLRLEKGGYKRVWFWLPANLYNHEVSLNLTPFYMRSQGGPSALQEKETSRIDLYRVSDLLLQLQTKLLTKKEVKEEDLQNLLTANPSLGSVHFLRAVYLLSQDKPDEAQTFLQDAVRYAPKEADFLSLFNEVADKNKAPAEAGGAQP